MNGLGSNNRYVNALTSNAISGNTLSHNGIHSNSQAPDWIIASSMTLDDAMGPAKNGTELAEAFLDALNASGPAADASPSMLQLLGSEALHELSIVSDDPVVTQLLEYAASCALNDKQALTLHLSSGSQMVFPGAIGLAPEWASGPLGGSSQELVSACLLARVNYFGIQVLLSLRGGPSEPAVLPVDADEAKDYPVFEGAFWGNLFAEPQAMYACGSAANVLNSYKNLRVCTTGLPIGEEEYASCGGMRHVGECDAMCARAEAQSGFTYASCGSNSNVVTVYLPKK